jgi:hypothetical protein
MNSIKLAQAIIRKAETDKANVDRYSQAIMALSDKEKKAGNTEDADFIAHELMEALYVAVG